MLPERERIWTSSRAQDKLARKINKRVMGMIEKSERDYDDLTAKKATAR